MIWGCFEKGYEKEVGLLTHLLLLYSCDAMLHAYILHQVLGWQLKSELHVLQTVF